MEKFILDRLIIQLDVFRNIELKDIEMKMKKSFIKLLINMVLKILALKLLKKLKIIMKENSIG